jgi:tetratricopeptide (TPR) repeat protein
MRKSFILAACLLACGWRAFAKPAMELPAIESQPPASSSLFISLPVAKNDPLKIVMPEGPLTAAQRDIDDLRARHVSAPDCLAVTLAGMEATRDRNYASAEEFLQRAIASDCTDGVATFYLGTLQEYRGRYQEALRTLQVARDQFSRSYPNHRYNWYCDATIGRTFFRLGRYQESLFFLNRMLKKYPDDLPHLFYYGSASVKAGYIGEGMGPLQKVVALSRTTPHSNALAVEAAKILAEIYWRGGQLANCEFYVDRALDIEPRSTQLQTMKRQVLEAKRSGGSRGGSGGGPSIDLFRGFGNSY